LDSSFGLRREKKKYYADALTVGWYGYKEDQKDWDLMQDP